MKKTLSSSWNGTAERVSFCSVATAQQSITIAGQTLVPNEDTAYVEFYMSHGFPVQTKYRTGIHPQVVANSYQTLNHKVFNLAHLMRKYNPAQNPRDRILGTVVAVEFPELPNGIGCACGCRFNWAEEPEVAMGSVKCPQCAAVHAPPQWTVGSLAQAPGIRAVAAMHKAAESVLEILQSWFTGENPAGGEWSVSMENSFQEEAGGFLVVRADGHHELDSFLAATPADLRALGYVYVSAQAAPADLLNCLNNTEDDQRDGITSARIRRDFHGQEVIFLLGGLDGKIRYRGVGLTPGGAMEKEARVSTMLASAPMVDVSAALAPFAEFGNAVFGGPGKIKN